MPVNNSEVRRAPLAMAGARSLTRRGSPRRQIDKTHRMHRAFAGLVHVGPPRAFEFDVIPLARADEVIK